MPRNGSGVYSKPAGTAGVPNTPIESAKYNQTVDDIVAVLNSPSPITAGGTGANNAPDALVNFGGSTGGILSFKSPGLHVATFPDQASFTSATIMPGIEYVQVLSYYAGGKRGGHLKRRLSVAPSPVKAWHSQDASGAWFEVVPAEVSTPSMFGAKSYDDTFNSGPACQAAIDFAILNGLSFLWVGLYTGSTQLVINASLSMQAAINRSHGYKYTPTTGDAIRVDTAQPCSLKGFSITGPVNVSSQAISTAGALLKIDFTASFGNASTQIENLEINYGFVGVHAGNAYDYMIEKCTIIGQSFCRILVRNNGTSSGFMNASIENNRLTGRGVNDNTIGVRVEAGYGVFIRKNKIRFMATGVLLSPIIPTHNFHCNDNFMELVTSGVSLTKGTSATDPIANNTIAANIFVCRNHIQAKYCITDDGLDNGTAGNCWLADVAYEGNMLFPDQDGGIAISTNANGVKIGGGVIDGSTAPNTTGVYLNKDAVQTYVDGIEFSVINPSIVLHPNAELRPSNVIGNNNRYDKLLTANEETIPSPASGTALPVKPFRRTIYVSNSTAAASVTGISLNTITVFGDPTGTRMASGDFRSYDLSAHDSLSIFYFGPAPTIRATNHFR